MKNVIVKNALFLSVTLLICVALSQVMNIYLVNKSQTRAGSMIDKTKAKDLNS